MPDFVKNIQGFIEGLKIVAAHSEHGFQDSYFLVAAHDVVYLNLDNEVVPEYSEEGKRLQQYGFFIDLDCDRWAYNL